MFSFVRILHFGFLYSHAFRGKTTVSICINQQKTVGFIQKSTENTNRTEYTVIETVKLRI